MAMTISTLGVIGNEVQLSEGGKYSGPIFAIQRYQSHCTSQFVSETLSERFDRKSRDLVPDNVTTMPVKTWLISLVRATRDLTNRPQQPISCNNDRVSNG